MQDHVPTRLFDDDPIASAFASQRRKALAEVDVRQPDALLARQLEDLAQEVMSIYRIRPVVIDWDGKMVDAADVARDGDAGEMSTRTTVTYFIPYSGSTGLFRLRPTSHRGKPPSGIVRPNELLLSYAGPSVEPGVLQNHLSAQEASVRRWVAWINADVEAFNRDLAAEVRDRLATRLAKARATADLTAALGFLGTSG